MQRSIIAAVVAAVLLTGWAMPSAAQQNGIVIQNNGVDSADSAAGADNVRISNISKRAVLERRWREQRNRYDAGTQSQDRGARNNVDAAPAEEYVAPVEEYVPPAEGDYQAYADEGYVEPVPVVEETVVDASTQQEQVLKLPSTGAGIESSMPWPRPRERWPWRWEQRL